MRSEKASHLYLPAKYATIENIVSYSVPEPNTGCYLWLRGANGDGYSCFTAFYRTIRAARAICILQYNLDPEGDWVAMHTCDTPLCVNPQHLRVGTVDENNADRDRKNRNAKGMRNGVHTQHNTKLTVNDVHEIRKLLAAGVYQADIARKFNVNQTTISEIHRKKTWAHV